MSSNLLKTSLKVLKLMHCNKKGYKSCSLGIPPRQDAERRITLLLSVSILPPSLPMENQERRNTSISKSGADLAATCLCQFQTTEAHLTGQNVLSTCVFLNVH